MSKVTSRSRNRRPLLRPRHRSGALKPWSLDAIHKTFFEFFGRGEQSSIFASLLYSFRSDKICWDFKLESTQLSTQQTGCKPGTSKSLCLSQIVSGIWSAFVFIAWIHQCCVEDCSGCWLLRHRFGVFKGTHLVQCEDCNRNKFSWVKLPKLQAWNPFRKIYPFHRELERLPQAHRQCIRSGKLQIKNSKTSACHLKWTLESFWKPLRFAWFSKIVIGHGHLKTDHGPWFSSRGSAALHWHRAWIRWRAWNKKWSWAAGGSGSLVNVNGSHSFGCQKTSVKGQLGYFMVHDDMGIFKMNEKKLELATVSHWPRSQAGVLLPGTTGGVERWPYFQHAWHPLRLLCPDCNLTMSQELSWVHAIFYFYFARPMH